MVRSAKTPAQRSRLIARWRASGIPLVRFARRHHIHPRTFWGWVDETSTPGRTGPAFVPVQVMNAPEDARPSDSSASVEIVLANGSRVCVVPGVSPSWVVAIVKGLQTAC
jgi:hypothetical protein